MPLHTYFQRFEGGCEEDPEDVLFIFSRIYLLPLEIQTSKEGSKSGVSLPLVPLNTNAKARKRKSKLALGATTAGAAPAPARPKAMPGGSGSLGAPCGNGDQLD